MQSHGLVTFVFKDIQVVETIRLFVMSILTHSGLQLNVGGMLRNTV